VNDNIEFFDILASTLHDTKNSLGMISNTLAEIIAQQPGDSLAREFSVVQYEIKRLNHNQMRLLSLYKAEKSLFTIDSDYHLVGDCIEDIVMQNEPIFNAKSIDCEIDCSEELFWTFDRNLVGGILDSILNNVFRYTKDKVRVSARDEGGYLKLGVEDNGPGYPESMFMNGRDGEVQKRAVNFKTGSMGLGFYFAQLVAKSHKNMDREGYIVIANGGSLGGGVFTLCIP
jgi:two-component system, OmpR family, sensor histidine kinase SenX3